MNEEQWQNILTLKGAAGEITLLGSKLENGSWQFCRLQDQRNESHTPFIVTSFKEALSLLGQSWKYLTPQYIHPDFKPLLWKHIKLEKGMHNLSFWRKACL